MGTLVDAPSIRPTTPHLRRLQGAVVHHHLTICRSTKDMRRAVRIGWQVALDKRHSDAPRHLAAGSDPKTAGVSRLAIPTRRLNAVLIPMPSIR